MGLAKFRSYHNTDSSITFSITDPDGKEGFPGEVTGFITYTLSGMAWNIQMVVMATTKTPIMLSFHVSSHHHGRRVRDSSQFVDILESGWLPEPRDTIGLEL